ncbi:MAG: hypothetical protein ACKVQK_01045 [Burkholderiales bacterium]
MKIAREDLKRLRLPLAVATVSIAAGIAFLFMTESWLIDARKTRDSAKKSTEQAQKKVDQVSEEEREIKENMLWYARMVSRGMLDQENRLDLIDSIAKIKTARKLYEIRYNMDSQKPLGYPGIKPAGNMDLVASRMKLDMQLLHEEDLLKFLKDLETAALSHVSVRRCTLDKIDRGPTQALAAVPRINSTCDIDLVAVKQVKQP